MKSAKNLKILLILLGVAGLLILFYFYKTRPKPSSKTSKSLSDTCVSGQEMVSVDLENSKYTSTSLSSISIAVPDGTRGVYYDVVAYKGGKDAEEEIYVYKDGVYAPDEGFNTGWAEVDVYSSPGEFSFSPEIPQRFASTMFLGMYLKAECQDGTESGLTRVVLDRHLDGVNLYSIYTNNPEATKVFGQ